MMLQIILLGLLFIYKLVELAIIFALGSVLLVLLSITCIFGVWFKPMRKFYLSMFEFWVKWYEQIKGDDGIVI